MMPRRFFAVVFVFAALLLLASVGAPPSLSAQTDDQPEAQPPTTVERLEDGEEAVLNEENKRLVGIGVVIVALAFLTTLILAFRRGRRNRRGRGKNSPPRPG